VTVAVPVASPAVPVQVSVYTVVMVGETDSEPLGGRFPVHPPLAAQLLASVADQVSVLDCPELMLTGLGVSVTVGPDTPPTMTVTAWPPAPPGPVHPRLYSVVLPGVTDSDPLVSLLPPKLPPLPAQPVALVEDQLNWLDCPGWMEPGVAFRETVGASGPLSKVLGLEQFDESPAANPKATNARNLG
jgi:hypothetical protein